MINHKDPISPNIFDLTYNMTVSSLFSQPGRGLQESPPGGRARGGRPSYLHPALPFLRSAMKALLYTEPYRFAYTDCPDPEPGPEDVVVRVQAVGICGSDVHGYTGTTGRRLPPLIMGHEASGVVAALGAAAEGGLRAGDRVCFDSTVYCNACAACRQGRYNRCVHRQVLGVSIPGMKRDGAMAEYVRLPWWTLHAMPEGLSFVQAALLEPVSIGMHAVTRAALATGETVLVVGTGTIGLFIVQAAKLAGAAKVIVSDPRASRLALARRLGADVTVDPAAEDLTGRVAGETEGRGADASFEVVGIGRTVQQAIAATRTGGRVVLVGNLTPRVEVPVPEVISKELTLTGSYASSGEYRRCIDLVASGQVDVLPLVSEVLPLSEGQHAFDRLHAGQEDLLKIVLTP
jgi:L-iditol 2-dehydrogenase